MTTIASSASPSTEDTAVSLSRRFFLIGAPLALAGCVTTGEWDGGFTVAGGNYGPIQDGNIRVPAMSLEGVNPRFLRQTVAYTGPHRAGTILVNTSERHLYFVLPNRQAIRYGIGVGREGLAFRGSGVIGRKAAWPGWTPTQNMIRRDPRNARYAGGMPGGLSNPLGARALYLHRGGRDTMFRLHGTNEPRSIGLAVSSGCIRLFNHDIIDLHNRARVGTPVIVVG